jgi:PAS domain S-box-containing protein/putative nucleotidyltransferase with HDIG domain
MTNKPKILVISDDRSEAGKIEKRLPEFSVISTLGSGPEALKVMQRFQPLLIFLCFPDKLEEVTHLCGAIRSTRMGHSLKILVLSAETTMEQRAKVYQSGADDLIKIPYAEEELRHKTVFYSQASMPQPAPPVEHIRLQLESVIENTPLVAIKGLDRRGAITRWNKTCEQIYGYNAAETIGKHPRDFFMSEEVIRELEQRHREILETGQASLPKEWSIHTRTGERRWLYSTMFPVYQEGRVHSVFCMDVDITRRIWAEEDRRLSLEKLRRALHGTIQAMALTVETRDQYTAGHMRRVADLAQFIGSEMGLPENTVEAIRMAAGLHDIGKIAVPAEILSKPSRLSRNEFALIKEHPSVGYDILKTIEFPWPLADIVHQHHELLDGSGYPQGLADDQIMVESSILTVADVVESISTHRPYRPSLGIESAFSEIEQNKGIKYLPEAVDACISLFREKGYQFDR